MRLSNFKLACFEHSPPQVSCDLSVKLFANDVTDDCNQGNQSNNAIKHKSSSKRGSSPSKGATNDQPISDFQVTPSSLSIPPFQHRYITVAYKPSALQVFLRDGFINLQLLKFIFVRNVFFIFLLNTNSVSNSFICLNWIFPFKVS